MPRSNKIKCLKVFNVNAVLHVFYYKGKLHCLSTSMLGKWSKMSNNNITQYLDRGVSYKDLIEKGHKIKDYNKGSYSEMPKGTKEKQNFLKLMIKR